MPLTFIVYLQSSAVLSLYTYASNVLRGIPICTGSVPWCGKIIPSWEHVGNLYMVLCVFPEETVNFLKAQFLISTYVPQT